MRSSDNALHYVAEAERGLMMFTHPAQAWFWASAGLHKCKNSTALFANGSPHEEASHHKHAFDGVSRAAGSGCQKQPGVQWSLSSHPLTKLQDKVHLKWEPAKITTNNDKLNEKLITTSWVNSSPSIFLNHTLAKNNNNNK